MRRTWPQRLVVGFNALVIMACVVGALGLWYSNSTLGALKRVTINRVAPSAILTPISKERRFAA